jgi:hypothetical protein
LRYTIAGGLISIAALASTPAMAQERPFLFSVTTADDTRPAARFDYDVGIGERAFQRDAANQPEHRLGVQASLGRLTLLAKVGISTMGSSYQSSQSGELLYNVFDSSRRVGLDVGGGVLHEADGVNVLLARVVAGRSTRSSDLYGNLLFQGPLDAGRDALDVITSVGWAQKLSHGMSLGIEALGEDLEGFWDAEEAEGGARLLIGPSLHVAPGHKQWQLTATGGPVFHPSNTGHVSDALRDLPPDTRRTSYAFKVALSVALSSGQ